MAVAEILQSTVYDWAVLGEDEKCSGYHALSLGYRDIFEEIAYENIKTFKRLGIPKIVVSYPEDYYTFKLRYPGVALFDVEVIPVVELFNDLIKDHKLQLNNHNRVVTYHDLCLLGRYCRLYEAPRGVITSIPGLDLVEMERNRRDAWCCGAGGGVKLGNKEYAIATAGKDWRRLNLEWGRCPCYRLSPLY